MASKTFSALTFEESIKESLYQQEGKKRKMCHYIHGSWGPCTCDIIVEEFSPCPPRRKNVIGVRYWETCLVWNPSTQLPGFGNLESWESVPAPVKEGRPCKQALQEPQCGSGSSRIVRSSVLGARRVPPHSPTLVSSQILKPLELKVPAKWPYCLPVWETLQSPASG